MNFPTEAERQRAREAVARIGYVLDVPLGLQGIFDRLYPPIVDAPEDGMDTTMPDNGHFIAPTPPDFDAAAELDALKRRVERLESAVLPIRKIGGLGYGK